MTGAIIGAAAQVGSSIYGAIKSSQANKRAMDILQTKKDENKKWYEDKLNEDYMQRADVQNILRKQRDLLGEQYKRARATNIVAGGTDESLALQQAEANKTLGETTADIAAQAANYKESVENQYRATEAALGQQEMGIHQQRAQVIANAAGQVGKAVSGLMTGVTEGNDSSKIQKEEAYKTLGETAAYIAAGQLGKAVSGLMTGVTEGNDSSKIQKEEA